jgi:hypothetical protein
MKAITVTMKNPGTGVKNFPLPTADDDKPAFGGICKGTLTPRFTAGMNPAYAFVAGCRQRRLRQQPHTTL